MMAAAPPMRSAFTTSFIMHGVILALMVIGLPFLPPPQLDFTQPIAIDIVDVGPVTTTQVQGMGQIAQKNDNAPAPTPPVPANKPEPAKPNAAEALPPVPAQNSLADLIANEAKNKPKEKPAEKAAASQPQFDNLLKNLSQLKPSDTNPAANPNAAATGPAAGAPGIVSDKLTISEEDALRRQIEQCWNIPSGAKDAQNMVVEIRVEVNPDKTVRTANILPNPMMGDPFFRAAAESARRAILNPNCSPLNLPEGREESWRVMTLRFNPKDVL